MMVPTFQTTTTSVKQRVLNPLRGVSRSPPRRRIGLGNISRKSNLEPGDIVTEIKMNVGQNGGGQPKLARIPQPVDVSSAPLPGMARGPPPIVSNIVTRPNINNNNNEIVAKPRAVPSASLTVQVRKSILFYFLLEIIFTTRFFSAFF